MTYNSGVKDTSERRTALVEVGWREEKRTDRQTETLFYITRTGILERFKCNHCRYLLVFSVFPSSDWFLRL